MAQKLFLGAFSMVLVNLILALQDQEGYNFNELNSQHGINYLVPPLQNQKEEQLESPLSIQAGLNERYGTQNYVPPSLTGQEQLPQFNQNPLRQYTNNQLSGQKDLLPQAWINTNDLQQFSSNQIVRSGQENLSPPGSNQYLTQEDVPPPAPPSSNVLSGQNFLPVPGSNQFGSQQDVPPPLPPGSSVLSGQNFLPVPGSNQYLTQEDVPPPALPSSNVLSGQNFLPVPGSNQFGSQQDIPPPVPPGSNVLSGQKFLPVPGSNQYLTQEDVPPPALPNSNVLSGQDFLPVPGSNQLATQEDVPLPVPPSSNALPGQDVLPPLGGNQLPMGEYVPPPVPPSSNQLGSLRLPETNQFPKAQDLHLPPASDILSNKGGLQPPGSNALKESNQVYGLDVQQQLTDPRVQKPYGNDIVPLPDNNQFAAGDMQPPVNPDMQVPFGQDSSAPGPDSNAFDEDKSEDSASSIENGFISPSKSMDVAMGDSEVEDESYDQEKNDFGSSESFEGSFYSSVLKGLGDVGEDNSLDSEYNSYDPLSLGSWNAEGSYGSEEQNQGTGWKPSGTGNIAPEKTAASYPQRTKLLPMGTSSRTDNTPLPNTLAVYCIPVVLLLLLLFLIRSNSYFHRTPKVVIVDPESRNRDIDAKAKEIEPLLRESMEYKDEAN